MRLVACLRSIALQSLSCDPKTGERYAVGFDTQGNPYRAYNVQSPAWRDSEDEDGFIYAA
jgi:hypothetical protein